MFDALEKITQEDVKEIMTENNKSPIEKLLTNEKLGEAYDSIF